MKATEFITEGKKNRRDVKRTVKPRNPVAHAAQKVAKGSGAHKDKKNTIPRKQKHKTVDVVGEDQRLDKSCWKGYKKQGTKMKGDTRVNNCVPEAANPAQQAAIAIAKKKKKGLDEVSPKGWEGTVKAMKKHDEIDNPWALAWSMKNKGYKSHKKEGFDSEYDDEAGMADNNLETMKRAVDGLDHLINAGDNLPEWCQEKIAVAKSMLVAVWDYMESEEHGVEESEYPFAGAKVGHKEGPAGQWRNKGPKAKKPAKPGDLVGGGM